ncbi:MAG: ABC-three component system protein [Bacteroidota bacterium]
MTPDEKYIARILLQKQILQSDGQEYENLFVKIMSKHNPNFQPIKPQGSYGDRKNDGFDRKNGLYYQVYAPEDIRTKEKATIEKLVTDFEGLYQFWNDNVTPIKKFNYVVNDKYKGAYPSLHSELARIESNHPNVEAAPFLSWQLEDVFLQLSDDNVFDIIGLIPNPLHISDVDPSILKEVINFTLKFESPYKPESIPSNPNFEFKIQFNGLNDTIGSLLDMGRLQNHIITTYFELNSEFTKDELRNKFTFFYKEGLKEIDNLKNKSDLLFFYILEKVSPNQTKPVQDAVIVLMAYFFEYCDIFETPPKKSEN